MTEPRDRLHCLLRAHQTVVSDLALPAVLRRIVQTAREVLGAQYAALGVVGPDGGLEQFVHLGVDEETVARIGALPEGKGLLGALIDDPRPIRLTHIGDDRRSVGFPDGHPPMDSFLGVPIRIRSEVYGYLYLAGSENGEFSAQDEQVVTTLAATAAIAVQNARLYEQAGQRHEWQQASIDVTRQLLAGAGGEPLLVIARRLFEMAGADLVVVGLPTGDGDQITVEVAVGVGSDRLTGLTYSPPEGTLTATAISTGEAQVVSDIQQQASYGMYVADFAPIGPVMAVPLVHAHSTRGALTVARRRGRRPFTDADLEMATAFANHAAIAMELADARADQQRVALLEDRDRIARDLHDHVIQRLFATGLTVQGATSVLGSSPAAHHLAQAVDDIDETIRQIRTSIFELRGALVPGETALRARMAELAERLRRPLGFAPGLRFRGPVDFAVPPALTDEVIAVAREALTNVARHAHAGRVDVELAVTAEELTLAVVDDGVGIAQVRSDSGLDNLRQRAERHGGQLTLDVREGGGTSLRWTVPLA
jgi:signal transduction histidine kinase